MQAPKILQKIDPERLLDIIGHGNGQSKPPTDVIIQETPEQAKTRRLRQRLILAWPTDQYRPDEDEMTLHQLLVDELAWRTKKEIDMIARVPEEKLRDIFERSHSPKDIKNSFESAAQISLYCVPPVTAAAATITSLSPMTIVAFVAVLLVFPGMYAFRGCTKAYQNRRLGKEIEVLDAIAKLQPPSVQP